MSSLVLLCRNGKQLVPQAEEGLTLLHIEAPQLHGWVSVPEERGRRGEGTYAGTHFGTMAASS